MDENTTTFGLPGKLEPIRVWALEGTKRSPVPCLYWKPPQTAVLATDQNVYAVSRKGPKAWRASRSVPRK